MSCERGVYREDCFNGIVEYQIFDSNKVLISRVEILAGYAGKIVEDRIADWLDVVDPVEPTGFTSPDALIVQPVPEIRAA
jgi:hypothetical protein